jgi:hypothetical protein
MGRGEVDTSISQHGFKVGVFEEVSGQAKRGSDRCKASEGEEEAKERSGWCRNHANPRSF